MSAFLSTFCTSPYKPPSWITNNIDPIAIPTAKLTMGRFPTPVHDFKIPGLEDQNLNCFIKRDDLTSCDLSGNKVRKLEFLLARAIEQKSDCIITPGGLQSNHARATAVAARQLGLDSYLILRKSKNKDGSDDDLGLTGNLLFDRMVGANIKLIAPGTYMQFGSVALCEDLAEQLREEGRNPWVIPIGGSNSLGAFGYIEFVRELMEQCVQKGSSSSSSSREETDSMHFDHIVFGCGSGGTAAGIALGVRLSGLKSQVHAVGVCDSPDEFYAHIEEVATELGVDFNVHGNVREWCTIYQGQGDGYARSTADELSYLWTFRAARASFWIQCIRARPCTISSSTWYPPMRTAGYSDRASPCCSCTRGAPSACTTKKRSCYPCYHRGKSVD